MLKIKYEAPAKIGHYYYDCGYIPRVVVRIWADEVEGRSLIDGTIGVCSIRHCGPTRIHRDIARRWAKTGPISNYLKQRLIEFYAGEWGNGRKIWW